MIFGEILSHLLDSSQIICRKTVNNKDIEKSHMVLNRLVENEMKMDPTRSKAV
jgi:hypothetical protein